MKTLYLPIFLMMIACQEPFESGNENVPDSLIENSKTLFLGDVTEMTSTKLNGVSVWKITVENDNGSVVVFYWRRAYTNLYVIEGTKGPFDYSLKPPFDVINFSSARFLATSNFEVGNITSWTFEPSPTKTMTWFYKFNGDGKDSPLVLDAGSGVVIR